MNTETKYCNRGQHAVPLADFGSQKMCRACTKHYRRTRSIRLRNRPNNPPPRALDWTQLAKADRS